MQLKRIGLIGAIAGAVLGGLVAVAGCDGTDDAVGGQDQGELHGGFPFHHRHRGQDAGSVGGAGASGGASGGVTTGGGMGVVTGGTTGGSAGTAGTGGADRGAVADCDVCTQAQQCCEVVDADKTACSFSAATCSAEVGDARPAYVNACLVFVVTVRGAWGGNPPAECR
jgi:hypothetical protein